MGNTVYLSGWAPDLCIHLDNGNSRLADFNRFLVIGFPSTEKLKQGGQFDDADRDGFILQIKNIFDKELEEGASHRTLYTLFRSASLYLRWCDREKHPAFSKYSLEGYMSHLQHEVMRGALKRSTYKTKHSHMVALFTRHLELPYHYFDNVVVFDNSDAEPYEAYTRSDLNQLLPFLRQVFKQAYIQFIENPDRHMKAWKTKPTMTFEWQGKRYSMASGITKMMCAATYLLAYYTYANTSDLLQLKRPNNASMSVGEVWYTMPAFKRRAFKTIQVEIGANELEIPKYASSFFDKLLNASKIIDINGDAPLLLAVNSQKVQPLRNTTLQAFLKLWVEKHFSFIDQTGRRLRPVVSRFRETGSQLTTYFQGEMINDIMLNNTPNTRNRHYSRGNNHTNNGMIQDAISIREEQITKGISFQHAKENLGIDVLVVEKEYKNSMPDLSRTPNGGSCNAPFGEKSKRYTKKAKKLGLAIDGERLACADLLKCFGCPNQVIVQSVSDIWCLLSFKACIEESLYLHLNPSHYRKNFEYIVQFIERKILPSLDKRILKQAEAKTDNGYHPAWSDSESILGLIPTSAPGVE